MAATLLRTLATSTAVGALVGTITEFGVDQDVFHPALQDPGRRALAGAVTGVAFGILKHCFGASVAIPVITFALIGAHHGLKKVYFPEENQNRIPKGVAIALIGVLIGYGLHSIPSEFWTGIADRMRFN